MQDQWDNFIEDDVTSVPRLEPWEGTVLNWDKAQVMDDLCFGRKQPFGSVSLPAASAGFFFFLFFFLRIADIVRGPTRTVCSPTIPTFR